MSTLVKFTKLYEKKIARAVLCIAISIYWGVLQTFEDDVELTHFSIPKCIPLKPPFDIVPKNTTFDESIHLAFIIKIGFISESLANGHFLQSTVPNFSPTLNFGPVYVKTAPVVIKLILKYDSS